MMMQQQRIVVTSALQKEDDERAAMERRKDIQSIDVTRADEYDSASGSDTLSTTDDVQVPVRNRPRSSSKFDEELSDAERNDMHTRNSKLFLKLTQSQSGQGQ